jgi:hypothetical protein
MLERPDTVHFQLHRKSRTSREGPVGRVLVQRVFEPTNRVRKSGAGGDRAMSGKPNEEIADATPPENEARSSGSILRLVPRHERDTGQPRSNTNLEFGLPERTVDWPGGENDDDPEPAAA